MFSLLSLTHAYTQCPHIQNFVYTLDPPQRFFTKTCIWLGPKITWFTYGAMARFKKIIGPFIYPITQSFTTQRLISKRAFICCHTYVVLWIFLYSLYSMLFAPNEISTKQNSPNNFILFPKIHQCIALTFIVTSHFTNVNPLVFVCIQLCFGLLACPFLKVIQLFFALGSWRRNYEVIFPRENSQCMHIYSLNQEKYKIRTIVADLKTCFLASSQDISFATTPSF